MHPSNSNVLILSFENSCWYGYFKYLPRFGFLSLLEVDFHRNKLSSHLQTWMILYLYMLFCFELTQCFKSAWKQWEITSVLCFYLEKRVVVMWTKVFQWSDEFFLLFSAVWATIKHVLLKEMPIWKYVSEELMSDETDVGNALVNVADDYNGLIKLHHWQ